MLHGCRSLRPGPHVCSIAPSPHVSHAAAAQANAQSARVRFKSQWVPAVAAEHLLVNVTGTSLTPVSYTYYRCAVVSAFICAPQALGPHTCLRTCHQPTPPIA